MWYSIILLHSVHVSMQVTFDENPAGPVSISPSAIVKIKTIEGDDYEMSNLVNRMLKFISYKLKFWSHKGVDYFKDYREYKEHAVSPEIAIKSKLPIQVKRNYINSIEDPKDKAKYLEILLKKDRSVSKNTPNDSIQQQISKYQEKEISRPACRNKGNHLTKLVGNVDRLRAPLPTRKYGKLHIKDRIP